MLWMVLPQLGHAEGPVADASAGLKHMVSIYLSLGSFGCALRRTRFGPAQRLLQKLPADQPNLVGFVRAYPRVGFSMNRFFTTKNPGRYTATL